MDQWGLWTQLVLAGIQPNKVPRRKPGQNSKHHTRAVFAINAIVLFIGYWYCQVGGFPTIHSDLHTRILQGLSVPGSGPVVGGHKELAITFEASQDSVVCGSILIGRGDNQRILTCGLEKPEQGLKRHNDAHVNEEQGRDQFDGFHGMGQIINARWRNGLLERHSGEGSGTSTSKPREPAHRNTSC